MNEVKNDIISYIYKTGLIDEVLAKYDFPNFVPYKVWADMKKDLHGYVLLHILDVETEDKIVDLFLRDKLKSYVAGIIKFSIIMKESEFYRKYLRWYYYKMDKIGTPEKEDYDIGLYMLFNKEKIDKLI